MKQLVLVTVFYLIFTLMELAIDKFTAIRWTSPRDINNILGLIAIILLWIWYFADKLRRK